MYAMLAPKSPELCLVSQRAPTSSSRTDVSLEREQDVVARIRQGDRAAFATLYQWYGDTVYRAILARCPDRPAAEDALRNTFRKAMEKIEQFEYQGRSIVHWLRRIGINEAMDVHRQRNRDRRLSEAVQAEPVPSTHHTFASPDRGLQVEDTKREVEQSLSMMNERYARVLKLRLIEERPRSECAELLDITVGTLDVLFHRACKAFRKVYPP